MGIKYHENSGVREGWYKSGFRQKSEGAKQERGAVNGA